VHEQAKPKATTRVTFPLYGFTFSGCEARLAERLLGRVPGVVRAYVNPWTEMAYVEYDATAASPAALAAAVAAAGLRAGAASPR
jgi:cation transport ATPase